MGISVMQDQVIGKIKWCYEEMGLNEVKEDSVEKYIIKKHYGIVATPQNKNLGNVDSRNGYGKLGLL